MLSSSSGPRSKPSKKPAEAGGKLSLIRFWTWVQYIASNLRCLSEVHGTYQKTILFVTYVRTSNKSSSHYIYKSKSEKRMFYIDGHKNKYSVFE
jgi:hypothetical protein